MLQPSTVLARTCLLLLIASSVSPGAAVEFSGTLRNRNGDRISGTITVIEKGPHLALSHHQVDDTGTFLFNANTTGALVVHARAPGHTSEERLFPAGFSGSADLHFLLPIGQVVEGRVVDANGKGVPDAAVRVRYHEPEKPIRSVAFDAEEITDGDGRFKFRNVGSNVLFMIDVYSPKYVASTSPQFKVTEDGSSTLKDIVLRKSGATVVATLLDKGDDPVPGVEITLIADPAGLSSENRGSWLHHKSFRQKKTTSSLGNVRFQGVPSGRIIVRAKTISSTIEEKISVAEGQEFRLLLRLL